METLYDLLGALPEDGAEDLRAAFRKAVKGTHPDINPEDPDAGLRFRQIVRANEILSDDEQRAAYDHLLRLADIERKSRSKRVVAATIHRLATGVMTLAVISLVCVSGYMLFAYLNGIPLDPVQATDRSGAEPAKTMLARFVDKPAPASGKRDLDGGEKKEDPTTIEQPGTLDADASALTAYSIHKDESMPAARDAGPADASFYHEQAISAYRDGDLYLALIKLDFAISLDPGSPEAYVDRSIVLHRLGDTKRAYADIARAKRIDDSGQRKRPAAASAP
jgi:curved DNA-binding protein CbpA